MGNIILIIGKSGAGKSASLRNMSSSDVGIFNVANKKLPFKSDFVTADIAGAVAPYETIKSRLLKSDKKTFIIDDSHYLMTFEFFDKATQTGYGKFTEIAMAFRNLLHFIMTQVPKDVNVYFLHHCEKNEHGLKLKTVGKMLDDQLCIEGLFTTVILTQYYQDKHVFQTSTNGDDLVKTPMGMFDEKYIDNDLNLVDQILRKYYE